MIDNNCIFCKLANGQIPTHSIYEDETFKVILDVSPATLGHCLILPKNHFDNIGEVPYEINKDILNLAAKIGNVSKKVFGATGYNILLNTGEDAGQTVFHCHTHVIPRYPNDNVFEAWETQSEHEGGNENVANKFKQGIANE